MSYLIETGHTGLRVVAIRPDGSEYARWPMASYRDAVEFRRSLAAFSEEAGL